MENVYHSESAMIRDLKRGSLAAFDSICELYAGQLYHYCKRYTRSAEDAEEIVQDTFIKLWNKREEIKQEDTLRALLFVISKHKLISAYRARANHPVYEEYERCTGVSSSDMADHGVEYADFFDMFRKNLETLPRTQRDVISLSRFHDLSNREVAERLELSEQTVKNQLSIGLKSMRELMRRVLTPPPHDVIKKY